jgi:hypothetical protein
MEEQPKTKRKRSAEYKKKKKVKRRRSLLNRSNSQQAFIHDQHPHTLNTTSKQAENVTGSKTKQRRQKKRGKRFVREVFIDDLPGLNKRTFIIDKSLLPVYVRRPFSRHKSSPILTAAVLSRPVCRQTVRVYSEGVTLMIQQRGDVILGLSACVRPNTVMEVANAGARVCKLLSPLVMVMT